jgi:hypothetical protein
MVLYKKNQVRKLPKTVQDYMRRKFNLPAEYLGILRYLTMGRANGKRNISISIFSPAKAREYRLVIKTTADLKRYPEMILFKGRIDNRGGVYIADRRGPGRGYRVNR